jgi:predicted ATPase
MHVKRIVIQGFKALREFEMELGEHLNIIVGDNETGKTTVLEAANLVLSCQMGGRAVQYDFDPYYFNVDMVADYFNQVRADAHPSPPGILIEAYLDGDGEPGLAKLKGTNNTKNEDCPGLSLSIELNKDLADDFKEYIGSQQHAGLMPVEYFTVVWLSFAGNPVVSRSLPFCATVIDTSLIRAYAGPSRYLSRIIDECLDKSQRISLSTAYRQLKQAFTDLSGVKDINKHLETKKGDITAKALTVSLDMSARSTWESAVTAHLDNIPFSDVGKGEQCSVQTKLAIEAANSNGVLLIEEPENHLSHSNMSHLIDEISKKGAGRQILIATHSSFVLNKLGIGNVRLLSKSRHVTTLAQLSKDTADYFSKLPGYDTLRLLLSEKAVLVEGPSDELVVQRAYLDQHGRLPLENRVDVIAVRSLAFKRFLEVGAMLDLTISVVTDNDGKVSALKGKYAGYLANQHPGIRICYDDDDAYPTLEDQLLKANSLKALNCVLGRAFESDRSLVDYMKRNKTAYALKLFQSKERLNFPEYIKRAIEA